MNKNEFITALESLVMPAPALNQFRIWHGPAPAAPGLLAGQLQVGARMPIAYASWTYLNAESGEHIKQGIKSLQPSPTGESVAVMVW